MEPTTETGTTREDSTAETYGNYEYTTSGQNATITKYIGEATTVIIPSEIAGYTVTAIGSGAFSGCNKIEQITFPESLTSIGENAFTSPLITELTLPKNLSYTGNGITVGAFSSLENLEKVVFQDGTTTISSAAVRECKKLKTVVIPEGVTSIGQRAFIYDEQLENVNLPTSLKSIGADAFSGCTILTTVQVPKSVTSIGSGAFSGDSNLTIYGYANSYAQTYATDNNIPFVVLDDEEEETGSGFDLKNDGHCIINTASSFSYDSWTNWFGIAGYKIPLERYQEVYGDSYTKHIYNQNISAWGGNCFGMSVTAAMFYKGKLTVTNYTHDVNTLTAGGYDDMTTSSGVTYLRLKKNSELTKLIERYQIWQDSNECYRAWVKDILNYESGTYAEAFSTIVSKVKDTKEPYLVLVQWKNSSGEMVGHALVVDSARTPKDLGDGWMRLYLYDPNNPYFEYFGEKIPASSYKQAENRFLDVNIKNGQWKMAAMVNGSGTSTTSIGYDDNGNILRKSTIVFVDVNDYPTNFNTKATFSSSDDSTNISYMSDNFEVYDSSNILVYKMKDGETTYIKDDTVSDYVSYGYIDGVDIGVSEGKLVLPKGEYRVSANNGAIAYMEDGNYAGVVSKDDIVVSNKDSTSLSISSNSSADVNVVIANVDSDKKYTSVETDIKTNESGCDISLNDTKLNVKTEDTQKIDIDVVTEDGEGSIEDVSSDNVDNVDVSSYVGESGETEYKISYDLNGGQVTGNPTTYTKDTETFTLKNPTKAGYTFTGWTGSNGNAPQKTVTITKGTTGDLSYVANWELTSSSDNNGGNSGTGTDTSNGNGGNSGTETNTSNGNGTDSSSKTNIATAKATLTKTSYVYNGKKKQPAVIVKNGSTTLINGIHYKVSYKNNKNIGTASVTITGIGNYNGSITKIFKIVPKGTSVSKLLVKKKGFSVKWKKQAKSTTGYQVQYSTSKKFKGKTTKIKTIAKKKTTKLTISRLKGKKKYYIRIRTYKTVKGKKYYSSWCKAKAVTTKK